MPLIVVAAAVFGRLGVILTPAAGSSAARRLLGGPTQHLKETELLRLLLGLLVPVFLLVNHSSSLLVFK